MKLLQKYIVKEFAMTKWVRMLTLIFSVLTMGFLACGNDNPASSETVTLTIINDLGNYSIHYVYVSLSESNSWGSDRLGAEKVLNPGKSVKLELTKGTYDIRIVDEDGDEYVKSDLQLINDYTWRVRLSDLSS